MTKSLRPGRVLIDWSQNDPHKTTVSVYSLRATATPLISTPLDWEEVGLGSRRRRDREQPLSLAPRELLPRVERDGDLFAGVLGVVRACRSWAVVSSEAFEAQLFGDGRPVGVARGERDRFRRDGMLG